MPPTASFSILPLLSGVATIAHLRHVRRPGASRAAPSTALQQQGAHELPGSFYAVLFVFYVVQYFVIIFFNTALVGAAIERLEGGDPTVASALTLARSRIGAILGYAVISATVGLLLRMIAERLGIIGRFIEAGAGLAWTVTTFLVVPVLAAEGVGPRRGDPEERRAPQEDLGREPDRQRRHLVRAVDADRRRHPLRRRRAALRSPTAAT